MHRHLRVAPVAAVTYALMIGWMLPNPSASGALQAQVAFSADQLDNLVAPIALYPDPLLAQVLVAATYPDQIDAAGRVVRGEGIAVVDGESWDVSVRAVAHYPSVLSYMADQLDWTTTLGQAYAEQPGDVMAAVQRMRAMAYEQGNLVTTPYAQVIVSNGLYEIDPLQAQYLYVPTYDPSVIFFRHGVSLSFGAGLAIGAWLNCDLDWGAHAVVYNGWTGNEAWRVRSRPFVRMTPAYVGNAYKTVAVNRAVVSRPVNYAAVDRFHAVHADPKFEARGPSPAASARGVPARGAPATAISAPVNNKIINRNINTTDQNLAQYRGRAEPQAAGRGAPAAAARPTPQPAPAARAPQAMQQLPRSQPQPAVAAPRAAPIAAQRTVPAPAEAPVQAPRAAPAPAPQPRPAPQAFNRNASAFGAAAAAQRGQASRAQMPPPRAAPAPAARPAPAPARPPAPGRKPPTGTNSGAGDRT